MEENIEYLDLNKDKKYFKLLPIKKDKNVIIYSVKYNHQAITKFSEYLNHKYEKEFTDIIDTEFYDAIPLSMGKYDLDKQYSIKNYKILELNKINQTNNMGMYFPEKAYGKIKVSGSLKPTISTIIEDTFLTDDTKVILDTTNLIKYTNHIFNLPNNFKFDKTIDLYRKTNDWKDKGTEFISLDNYRNHLKKLAYNLNDDNITLTDREDKKIQNDINEIINNYQELFEIEQIGMFPVVNKMDKNYAILTRFGLRNQNYDWHFNYLDNTDVNYDGGLILRNFNDKIVNNYDLDGFDYEFKALKSIKNNENLSEIVKIKKTS